VIHKRVLWSEYVPWLYETNVIKGAEVPFSDIIAVFNTRTVSR
jgi:hypothetical protein